VCWCAYIICAHRDDDVMHAVSGGARGVEVFPRQPTVVSACALGCVRVHTCVCVGVLAVLLRMPHTQVDSGGAPFEVLLRVALPRKWTPSECARLCVCVRACVRACLRACVRVHDGIVHRHTRQRQPARHTALWSCVVVAHAHAHSLHRARAQTC
jgi:hypothetical protein